MAKRFKVTRQWVKWPPNHTGVMYKEGDLLPKNFTERDRYRTMYPSRISLVEVDDDTAGAAPASTQDGAADKSSAQTGASPTAPPVPPATSAPEAEEASAEQELTEASPSKGSTNAKPQASQTKNHTGTSAKKTTAKKDSFYETK